MKKHPIGIWKGIPSTWNEFWKEVFWLWLLTAMFFAWIIAFVIVELMILFGD